ncbi:MAG: hypothetical protein JSW72_01675 [Candidatus Bathyarchaeota archaeon]|nr:MAG: hypothetical protein JSW72_01675 [Candidatus Bathyarchaeota archaeon]
MDIASISALVAAGGVLVGVAFAYLEVRNLAKQRETDVETRQAELFMQIYSHYYKEDFLSDENQILYQWKWKDFDDFWKKYGPETNPESFSKWDSMGTYFRGIGVLVKRKLIDPALVDELMGTSIKLNWEKSGSIVLEFRKRLWPDAYKGFEYLYNEMLKREQTLPAHQ